MSILTLKEMENLTQEKINSPQVIDRLVADELLEMGFGYNTIGTHLLHDSIVCSLSMDVHKFSGVFAFCVCIKDKVCKKYNLEGSLYTRYIE